MSRLHLVGLWLTSGQPRRVAGSLAGSGGLWRLPSSKASHLHGTGVMYPRRRVPQQFLRLELCQLRRRLSGAGTMHSETGQLPSILYMCVLSEPRRQASFPLHFGLVKSLFHKSSPALPNGESRQENSHLSRGQSATPIRKSFTPLWSRVYRLSTEGVFHSSSCKWTFAGRA